MEVEDHPLDYGDFEGTIPKGQYGGGTVQLWDRGYWAPQGRQTPEDALRKGELKFVMAGERLQGGWVLVRMKHDRERRQAHQLAADQAQGRVRDAERHGALLAEDRSVASGRTMEEIAAGKGKAPQPFMLAKSGERRRGVAFEPHGGTAGRGTAAAKPRQKRARSRRE